MLRTYRWSSLVDPSQVDIAQVDLLSEGVRASGTQTTGAYTAQWELDASRAWTTTRLVVEVRGYGGWGRRLDLRRDPDSGEWSAATTETGDPPGGLAPPGLAEGVDLSGSLDCDLGRCPMTNLMPIRRLDLLSRRVEQQALVMAWVDMPSLAVIASDQYYASARDHRVRYVSGTRQVDVELTVDEVGMVIHYPDLAVLAADTADTADA